MSTSDVNRNVETPTLDRVKASIALVAEQRARDTSGLVLSQIGTVVLSEAQAQEMVEEIERLRKQVATNSAVGSAIARLADGHAMELWWQTTGEDWPVPEDMPARFLRTVLDAVGEKSSDSDAAIAAISNWLDNSPSYRGLDPETMLWRRLTKPASEAGEVIDAFSDFLGENPRKGVIGTMEDVKEELLDTAVAALGALYHVLRTQDDQSDSRTPLELLDDKIRRVAERAGVLES